MPGLSPARLLVLGAVAATTPDDLDKTIRAADQAQRGSWAFDGKRRQKALWRWADRIEEHADELAGALVAESGKPVREARFEVAGAVDALRYNAGLTRHVHGRAGALPDSSQAHLMREPVGVTALIVPWNWPLLLLLRDLAPALAAGGDGAGQTCAADDEAHAVLMVRESPLHAGHLRLMAQEHEAGATIMPPVPAFYANPATIDDLVTQTIGRALDALRLPHPATARWSSESRSSTS